MTTWSVTAENRPYGPQRWSDPLMLWKRVRPLPPAPRRILVEVGASPAMTKAALERAGFTLVNADVRDGKRFWTAVGPEHADPDLLLDLPAGKGEDGKPGGVAHIQGAPFEAVADSGADFNVLSAAAMPTARPVLGVIDDRCAFLHRQFCTRTADGSPPQTRFLALWDQFGPATAAPWKTPDGFGYGRELLQADIAALLARAIDRGGSQEATYRSIGHELPPKWPGWSHGTHVLAIAGGAEDPFRPGATDEAGDLKLIAVQLPSQAVARTHGLWLNTYVLDGLQYIMERAPDTSPVIVTVSLAGNVGPHDGHSMLERAIDGLIEQHRGRLTVVLAAGNARRSRLHAMKELPRRGDKAVFALTVPAGDSTPNFVDAWVQGASTADVALSVSRHWDQAEKENSGEIRPGQAFVRHDGDTAKATALATLSLRDKAPNGKGWQAFVGIAQTASAAPNPPAEDGEWRMTVENKGDSPLLVHAWIARDDVPAGHMVPDTPHQLQFRATSPIQPDGTISSIACGAGPIVVGGYVASATGSPLMYEDSGAGHAPGKGDLARPIRGPDACGPAAMGGQGVPDIWYFSDEEEPHHPAYLRKQKGTSMAAPFVARRLANVIVRNGGRAMQRTELLEALRKAYPSLAIPAGAGDKAWTSDHWVPAG